MNSVQSPVQGDLFIGEQEFWPSLVEWSALSLFISVKTDSVTQ